jgi:acyl-activating enzyme 14
MEALSGMYKKSLANNKVQLMKKLFNLKMTESTSVTQHLNNFNSITNQFLFVEIEFDDEICALILLASLSSNWEGMRTTVSNSAGKSKLKYKDIRDLILAEEYIGKTQMKVQVQFSTLTLEGEDKIKAYPKTYQNPDTGVKASLDLESRLNIGIVANSVIT